MADENILIIKFGALGNVVLSLSAFAAIRRHHPEARISVLTTAPYADWLAGAPYFDAVLVDQRPEWWDFRSVLRLRRMLVGGEFSRVYDLQTSGRSSLYFRLFPRGARPEWSGIARGCSHPDRDPQRDFLHDARRQQGQLRQAGISEIPVADLSWSRGKIERFGLPRNFFLLVPGSSPHRLVKRWPVAQYRALAVALAARGITPVVVGGAAERELAADIAPAIDLTGRTGFGELAELARSARFAVGNDTGPMHLIATAGCRSVVLFSADSDPALCAPVGPSVTVFRRDRLGDLSVEEVLSAF
jgi:ADP-heptose:LPS heptosyltransferase